MVVCVSVCDVWVWVCACTCAYRMKSADQKPLSQDVNTHKARLAGGSGDDVVAIAHVVDVVDSWLTIYISMFFFFVNKRFSCTYPETRANRLAAQWPR